MLLATRCPFCETVFRLLPAHLAARRGLVRCGHCQEVFDASGSLYELPASGDFRAATPVSAETAAALTAGIDLPEQVAPIAPSAPPAPSHEYLETPPAPSSQVGEAALNAAAHEASLAAGEPQQAVGESHRAEDGPDTRATEPSHTTPAHDASAPAVEHAAAPFGAVHAGEAPPAAAPEFGAPHPYAAIDEPLHSQPPRTDPFAYPSGEVAQESPGEAFGRHAGIAAPDWREPEASPPASPQTPHAPHDPRDPSLVRAAPPGAGPELPGSAPDFASPSWDPWAPPPDVQFDQQLRYTKTDLPYTTFAPAVAPMRRPKHELQRTPFEPASQVDPHAPHAPVEPAGPIEPMLPPDHLEPGFLPPAEGELPTLERELPPPHQWKPAEREAPATQASSQVAPESPASSASPVEARATEPSFVAGAAGGFVGRDSEPHFGSGVSDPFADPTPEPPRDAYVDPASAWLQNQPAHQSNQQSNQQPNPQFNQPFAAPLPDDGGEHFAVIREARMRNAPPLGWTVLGTVVAVLLAVLLIAQLAWWQRETVMVYWPSSQPLFAGACEQLGCTLAPPRDIDGLVVEPSDLREVENNPHKLELRMPLRNRFSVALAYPAVELTLLDEHNNIVVRRVLLPQDYVRPGTPIGAGLPAHASQTMIVRLDLGAAVASNFLAQIFYP